jgi:hypothetical protein
MRELQRNFAMETIASGGALFFNGIEGRTGNYLYPPMEADEILAGLRKLPKSREKALMPGIDPKDLAQTGWGVVFHEHESPEIRDALAPLLARRRVQAGQRYEHLYRDLSGAEGYRDGMGKEDFLAACGAATGPVNPHRLPYYLLLIGGPERIPFHFQHQLDVQYAVGRLAFDTAEEYARYARSVVEAETSGAGRGRKIVLFAVQNPDDVATALTADRLVRPLAERLGTPVEWQQSPAWEVGSVVAEEATKARLRELLGGAETPALLFTASHGMGFFPGDPLQRDHQGALLCQDWPGPEEWKGSVPPELYFSGDDVSDDARAHGLVVFHFACHGAGTPATDEFARRDGQPPPALAPAPFVARLPQRLLAHPAGGVLAVIGHVERAWAYSFLGKGSLGQTEAFESTLRVLMDGYPVGYAMEWFNQRYGELAADLTLALQRLGYGDRAGEEEIAALWTANNDARNYAVVGDPAVRVMAG